jgi:Arm DNA-binding domain
MADKVKLTDRKLMSLKPAKAGQRYEVMDTDVSGFGVRVTDKGKRTFFLLARYPGSANPTRRAVGEYPTDSLADAHKKARKWRDWIKEGKTPRMRRSLYASLSCARMPTPLMLWLISTSSAFYLGRGAVKSSRRKSSESS